MNPSKRSLLYDRGRMLAAARQFFNDRHVIEVDCPLITQAASVDANIDLIPVCNGSGLRYLHSSPEYGMKRLIVDGIGDCYQMAHVFRASERSPKHNPEFTMVEWYRLGMSFEAMIEETIDFVRLFLGDLPHKILSYREAIKTYTSIDYVHATNRDLLNYLADNGTTPYAGLAEEGKDDILNVLLGTFVEPHLGSEELCALAYYPASQAALAKTCSRGDEVAAERFEIYYHGIELANGYHELADANEQRRRLEESNAKRMELGKEPLPIDERFLQALETGLPDCCGVAVGFDRLMMLKHDCNTIDEVIPFTWENA